MLQWRGITPPLFVNHRKLSFGSAIDGEATIRPPLTRGLSAKLTGGEKTF